MQDKITKKPAFKFEVIHKFTGKSLNVCSSTECKFYDFCENVNNKYILNTQQTTLSTVISHCIGNMISTNMMIHEALKIKGVIPALKKYDNIRIVLKNDNESKVLLSFGYKNNNIVCTDKNTDITFKDILIESLKFNRFEILIYDTKIFMNINNNEYIIDMGLSTKGKMIDLLIDDKPFSSASPFSELEISLLF